MVQLRVPTGECTLVVAASDAHRRSIAQAHFRCDGTEDDREIQGAIDALPSGGGRVVLSEGLFTITAVLNLNSTSNVHLHGQGHGLTILQVPSSGNNKILVDNTTLTDITIEAIEFDGNGSNQSDGASRSTLNLVELDSKTRLTVKDCFFHDCRHGAAMSIELGTDVKIINNSFLTNGVAASTFICDHIFAGRNNGILIQGNDFNDCSDAGVGADNNRDLRYVGNHVINNVRNQNIGLGHFNPDDNLQQPLRAVFIGNSFDGNFDSAIFCGKKSGESTLAEDIAITGNTFKLSTSGNVGIDLKAGCSDIAVTGNVLNIVSGATGIKVAGTDVLITSNSFKGAGTGIDGDTGADDLWILSNDFDSLTGTAIAITPATWNLFHGNIGSGKDDLLTDLGDGNAIPIAKSGHLPLVSGGAETRTIADAAIAGLTLDLYFKTDGGDCVITAASPVNQTGNTIMTFADVGDHIRLTSIEDGSDFEWRVVANDGVALS